MTTTTVGFWPVNENGAIVLQSDRGTDKVKNYLPQDWVPTDSTTTRTVVKLPGDIPMQTGQVLRFAVAGDSISEMYNFSVGASVVKISDTVARFNFSAAAAGGAYWKGDKIKVTGAATEGLNQQDATVLAVDAARMWVEYDLKASRTNPVLDTSADPKPTMYRKYSVATSAYLAQACALLGIGYKVSVDATAGGGDSLQVGKILARDWVESDVGIYACGMNDVYSRGWTFEQIKANDIANIAILRQAARLVIFSVPPRWSGQTVWTAGKYAVWRKVNEWRRQYAEAIGADYVDVAACSFNGKTYADPLDVNSNPYMSGVNMTCADGVHPVGIGGLALGSGLAAVLATVPWIASKTLLPTSASANTTEGYVVQNPLMKRTTGGTASGTVTYQNLAGAAGAEVADSYTLASVGGSAATVVKVGIIPRDVKTHADTYGNAQRLIIDNTSGASAVTMTLQTLTYGPSMVDGDSVRWGANIILTDAATPGTGTPNGVTSVTVQVNDQHSISLNKFATIFAPDGSTGTYPACNLSPSASMRMRTIADGAGAYSNVLTSVSVVVPVGKTACVDIGRVLTKRLFLL